MVSHGSLHFPLPESPEFRGFVFLVRLQTLGARSTIFRSLPQSSAVSGVPVLQAERYSLTCAGLPPAGSRQLSCRIANGGSPPAPSGREPDGAPHLRQNGQRELRKLNSLVIPGTWHAPGRWRKWLRAASLRPLPRAVRTTICRVSTHRQLCRSDVADRTCRRKRHGVGQSPTPCGCSDSRVRQQQRATRYRPAGRTHAAWHSRLAEQRAGSRGWPGDKKDDDHMATPCDRKRRPTLPAVERPRCRPAFAKATAGLFQVRRSFSVGGLPPPPMLRRTRFDSAAALAEADGGLAP